MRLSFLELAGFRGVRSTLRIEFAPGFTVITGRNGSGKSTICDGIEYALTGAISKYVEGKERGESLEDYIWWRGRQPATERYVTLGVAAENGEVTRITRRPGDATHAAESQALSSLLCSKDMGGREGLLQLCRTAVIRDETLAALSVDLTETARFAFVRAAIGTDALESVSAQGKILLDGLRRRTEQVKGEYAIARQQVTTIQAQLAAARQEASQATDGDQALSQVATLLAVPNSDPDALEAAARTQTNATRQRIDELIRLARMLDTASTLQDDASGASDAREDVRLLLERERAQWRTLSTQIADAERRVKAADIVSVSRLKLAALYDSGRAIGLIDSACPLCATSLTHDRYEAALVDLGRQLQEGERASAEALRTLGELQVQSKALMRVIAEMEQRATDREAQRRANAAVVLAAQAEAGRLGVQLSERLSSEAVSVHMVAAQERLSVLQEAAGILSASAALDRVAEWLRKLGQAQEQSVMLERRLAEASEAHARAKRLLDGIRRSVGELVEERLAALEPLLNDLYGRLRPHVEWSELSYHLRGDIQRSLSLRVGEEINPRFTFSSGQRRAIGLAFLLAVHLSRPWCMLRSLILDDPIQHIDDYRALHLVEVLAAVRLSGQQVVCAVEDPALAQVLCRRLRTGVYGEGALVEMRYRAGNGATADRTVVTPAIPDLTLSA
jgi:chromosome segregation protein